MQVGLLFQGRSKRGTTAFDSTNATPPLLARCKSERNSSLSHAVVVLRVRELYASENAPGQTRPGKIK